MLSFSVCRIHVFYRSQENQLYDRLGIKMPSIYNRTNEIANNKCNVCSICYHISSDYEYGRKVKYTAVQSQKASQPHKGQCAHRHKELFSSIELYERLSFITKMN